MTQVDGAEHARPVAPDPEQRMVIEAAPEERMLVIAGPGTGKTQVAAMRLAHLLRSGLQPAEILVLSFSRSAVATLSRRLKSLGVNEESLIEDLRHLAIRTFDSWAFRMLRQGGEPVSTLLTRGFDRNIEAATEALRRGDETVKARLSMIRHVIVDEFQDLPGVRAEMVTALLSRLNADGRPTVGFTVLGDPVQAIYRFASRSQTGDLPRDPWVALKETLGPGIREIALEKNHRSTPELVNLVRNLRKILDARILDPGKKLAAMNRFLDRLPISDTGSKLSEQWLSKLPEGSLAILTRTNGEALKVWQTLLGKKTTGPSVPVRLQLAGATPAAPGWIAALLFRYRHSTLTREVFDKAYGIVSQELDEGSRIEIGLPPIDCAWQRLARASGTSDAATVIQMEALRERLCWPDSFPDDQLPDRAAVHITTVHQAKGMEFDNVALLDPKESGRNGALPDPLEAANVGFVAVTRAGRNLGRLPNTCIYDPPSKRDFDHGRVRQVCWGKMVNVQMGLPGDIEPASFLDGALHGGEEGVRAIQDSLLRHAGAWRDHKVMLRKVEGAAKALDVRYDIHLQVDDGDGPFLGRTDRQLTKDLLDLLWKPGYALPMTIYNLRIAGVSTQALEGDLPETVPDPWRTSRMCLGVVLAGTGDFKTWKRKK